MSDFSCDLVATSKKHVAFLRHLHALGATLEPVTPAKLHRYVQCWLPLVAANSTRSMIPPPDVAWLWHCHRLAPAHYETYTIDKFGRVLEASPPFSFQEEAKSGQAQQETEQHAVEAVFTRNEWEKAYPNEAFFLASLDSNNHEKCTASGNLHGFDLVASCACQANFLWQVSGPRFHDDAFLHQAVDQYYKFLKLSNNDKLPLVPTYQIDLMWHTHILHSSQNYTADCQRIRGKPFHHDDSLNDRTAGALLERAFAATAALWKQTYHGEDYVVPGGMYRGEPPTVYYDAKIWTPQLGYDAGDAVVQGSSSSGTAITWEFRNDDGGWTAYREGHQAVLENTYQTFLASRNPKIEVKTNDWTYQVDVEAMVQENVEHAAGKKRNVRRRTAASGADVVLLSASGEQITWEFEDDTNWTPYSSAHQKTIEDAYQNFVANPNAKIQIRSDAWTYEVDVYAMVQKNMEHHGGKTRVVRRRAASASASRSGLASPFAIQPWSSPHDPGCFIVAAPKSTVRNVSSNDKRQGYVFGRGSAGDGYYSLDTTDAYEILYARLKTRERYARSQFVTYDCTHCLCCLRPSPAQVREKEALEDKWQELKYMAAFAQAKRYAAGPNATPDRDSIARYLDDVPRSSLTPTRYNNTDTIGSGAYLYSAAYICDAGGCGGGDGGCGAGCG